MALCVNHSYSKLYINHYLIHLFISFDTHCCGLNSVILNYLTTLKNDLNTFHFKQELYCQNLCVQIIQGDTWVWPLDEHDTVYDQYQWCGVHTNICISD